jgi:hypothetical protein
VLKTTVPFFLVCALVSLPLFAMNMFISAYKIVLFSRIGWFAVITTEGLIFITLYFFCARRANFIAEKDLAFFKEKLKPFIPAAGTTTEITEG